MLTYVAEEEEEEGAIPTGEVGGRSRVGEQFDPNHPMWPPSVNTEQNRSYTIYIVLTIFSYR